MTTDALATFIPMNVLSHQHRVQLLEQASVVELDCGESFDTSTEDAEYTYYLCDGVFELCENDRVLATMTAGDDSSRFAINRLGSERIFGRAACPVKLLRVDISLVSTLVIWMQSLSVHGIGGVAVEDSKSWVARLLSSELFTRIPPANIPRIFDHLESFDVQPDQVIIKYGERGDFYYIVRQGYCSVTREVEPGSVVLLASLGPGDSFGEEALLSNATRNATVTMVGKGVLMCLTQADFRQLITTPLVSTLDVTKATQIVTTGGRGSMSV